MADEQVGVAVRDEVRVCDAERGAQLLDAVTLDLEAAGRRGDRLELDEVAKALDAVEVDAHVAPAQQPAGLLDDDLDAEGLVSASISAWWSATGTTR